MRARRVRPLALAAHRFNRQLRAAGAAVSPPDLHRALGLLILPGIPVRLAEDRDKLRGLLLLGIATREGRVHPRFRAWYAPGG